MKSGRKRKPGIPGICGDAKRLGVRREHLWMVLTGRRHSKPLIQRYHALQRVKRAAGATA